MDHIETRAYKGSPVYYEINHTVGVVFAYHTQYGLLPESSLSRVEQRLKRNIREQAFTVKCEGCGDRTHNPEGLCYQCQCEMHATGEYNMDGGGLYA